MRHAKLPRLAQMSLIAVAALAIAPPVARAADKAGCADIAGLKRFQGSSIVICEKRDFAEYVLPTGKAERDADGALTDKFGASLNLEGRLTQNVYAVPMGPSSAEVFRNYKADLDAKGYKVLFEAKGPETTKVGDFFGKHGPGTQLWDDYNSDSARYVAALKEEGGVKTYFALFMNEHQEGYEPQYSPTKNQVMVRLDALQVGELTDRMVVVSSAEIAKSLDDAGKVALYGILFDFNKATLKPESRPTLDQVGKYLKDNPGQRIYVIGHTDNVGGFDFNMQLSQARAATVVGDLVKTYDVAQGRLRAGGVGLQAPVAPNATEDGRTKNRRVELLPQ